MTKERTCNAPGLHLSVMAVQRLNELLNVADIAIGHLDAGGGDIWKVAVELRRQVDGLRAQVGLGK